jgi:soluble epoxide hydrolase/lipid-phosphate phosphatase
MEQLRKKALTTTRSLQYTYYVSPPSNPNLPTVLLLHGWPDDAHLWSDLISKHLLPAGYGVLAPDCLGYSGTSKPTTTSSYNSEGMSADLCEILDAEDLLKVISLGHDWFVHTRPFVKRGLRGFIVLILNQGAASSPNASGSGTRSVSSA